MSLVVAEVTADGPRIVSDMRVTFPEGPRSRFKTNTLKAIAVRRDVSICFAGDVVTGLDGVRHFAAELEAGYPVDALLGELQEMTSHSKKNVEFVLATPQRGSELIRIRDGEVERSLQSAWIGDQKAFELFQNERLSSVGPGTAWIDDHVPAGAKIMSKLNRAMDAVIENSAVQSVGDFCIALAFKSNGFEYLESMFIHVGRDITVRPGEDLISKMAHPVQEGGYSVCVVPPAEPGTAALGLHFPQARLGMLYLPLQFDEAQVIADVGPDKFSIIVLERFGVRMQQPMLR